MTDTTQDDDFHPATAGDDPIWLGGVEYITKSRSDDLVQAAVAAERERCAKVAEGYLGCEAIAAAIREGGK